ncbi:MAG: riboflavin synthase [Omnitrophica bacterium]|nr:riboflavin synthase [Candidatus Omnitrophota bacterium]
MFSGIVEETGFFKGLSRAKDAYRLKIATKKSFGPVKKGDSVSINGACLTLVGITNDLLLFDVTGETFAGTSLRYLRHNAVCNVERALQWKSRIDGHFVSGHVDGVRTIKNIRRRGGFEMDMSTGKEDSARVVKKGSIAIDGISLTISNVYDDRIRLSIIPFTLLNTNLRYKKIGDKVNVEFDILGKYAERALCGKKEIPAVTDRFLKMRGFI